MQHNNKRVLFSFILSVPIFLIWSCTGNKNKDDETPMAEVPEPEMNQVVWQNELYDFQDGLLIDYGSTTDGYDVDVVLTDATLVSSGNEDSPFEPDSNGIGFLLGITLSSDDENEITSGEYLLSENTSLTTRTFTAELLIDQNGNRELEDSTDFDRSVNSGTISISGSGTTYTISFEMTLGGEPIKGSFNRTMKYSDQRD